jgi:hypothetical protein
MRGPAFLRPIAYMAEVAPWVEPAEKATILNFPGAYLAILMAASIDSEPVETNIDFLERRKKYSREVFC